MTNQEAIELQTNIEKALSEYLGIDVSNIEISLSLLSRLKVSIHDSGEYLFNKNNFEVDSFNTKNNYITLEEFSDIIANIQKCFEDIKKDAIQLVWSYEHMSELTN